LNESVEQSDDKSSSLRKQNQRHNLHIW